MIIKSRHDISILKAPRLDKNKGIYQIQLFSSPSTVSLLFNSRILIILLIKYIMALVYPAFNFEIAA